MQEGGGPIVSVSQPIINMVGYLESLSYFFRETVMRFQG